METILNLSTLQRIVLVTSFPIKPFYLLEL